MRPHNDPLSRLRVVSPCTEDWNQMVGNDAVRFCSHCQLHVHDVASITRVRALEIVRESGGRLCMRIERRPDGRVRTADVQPGFFSITRRVPRAAAGVLSLAVGVSTATAQQAAPACDRQAVVATDTDQPQLTPSSAQGSAVIAGVVMDAQGAVVAGTRITLTETSTGQTTSTETDSEGQYDAAVAPGTYEASVSATGFRTAIVTDITAGEGVTANVAVTLEVTDVEALTGVIAISSPGDEMVRHWDERDAMKVEDAKLAPIFEAGDDSRKALWRAISRGDNVNARNGFGETALMLFQYDRKTVARLIEAGAAVDARDLFGVTPLMVAAASGNRRVARELLERGARVNLADNKGHTALIIAAANHDQKMVQLLWEAGADRRMRDADGKIAADYFPREDAEKQFGTDAADQ